MSKLKVNLTYNFYFFARDFNLLPAKAEKLGGRYSPLLSMFLPLLKGSAN